MTEISDSIFQQIKSNTAEVDAAIKAACSKSSRDLSSVTLVAVSKRQPIERVKAYLSLREAEGILAVLGENYVQEYRGKKPSLLPHTCHLIGPLQSNKAKQAVVLFDLIETIHSEKLAAELNKELLKANKTLSALVQVNVSEDKAKSGILIEDVKDFVLSNFSDSSPLKFAGLMTITAFYDNPKDARPDFKKMHQLKLDLENSEDVRALLVGGSCELSMGMSSDFDIAIEEGATIVRVGSSIFGARDYA